MSKPRYYSTVSTSQFRKALSELTNNQLRLWLYLEYKAGSDESGIPSDDPDLKGCRYIRMKTSTITKTLSLSRNQATLKMLDKLQELGYILAHSQNFILIPEQGETKKYFQNYENILHTKYWKLITTLLANKIRIGDNFITKAGINYLKNTAIGTRLNGAQKLAWVRQALQELQDLDILKLYKPNKHKYETQEYIINLSSIIELGLKPTKKKCSIMVPDSFETDTGTIIESDTGTIINPSETDTGTIIDMTPGPYKENPFLKNPPTKNPLKEKTRNTSTSRIESCQVEVNNDQKLYHNLKKLEEELSLPKSKKLNQHLQEFRDLKRKMHTAYEKENQPKPNQKRFLIDIKKAIKHKFNQRLNLEQIITNAFGTLHNELEESLRKIITQRYELLYSIMGNIITDMKYDKTPHTEYITYVNSIQDTELHKTITSLCGECTTTDIETVRRELIRNADYEQQEMNRTELRIKEFMNN